jgi:S-adenosylmethionine hydrolase
LPAPLAVWYIDNFGNCKTTAWAEDIKHKAGTILKTQWGKFMCYDRLKDVPNGESGVIVGSSGYREHRFIEIVVQGKSAAAELGIKIGDRLDA